MGPEQLVERHIERVPETGCWIWTGALNLDGYGVLGRKINNKNKLFLAHRVVYQLNKGNIPKGFQLDHLCRVRCCVNPNHLEPVTPQENIKRGLTGENYRSKTHCPYGHPYTGNNLYVYPENSPRSGKRKCRTCNRERERRSNGRS